MDTETKAVRDGAEAADRILRMILTDACPELKGDAFAVALKLGRGAAEAATRVVLHEACKPWRFSTGAPPDYDGPLTGVFCAGMAYSESLLAKLLGVERYEGGDGSEDFDCDATKTLSNILAGAGLYDPEDGRWATLAAPSAAGGGETPPPPTAPQGADLAGLVDFGPDLGASTAEPSIRMLARSHYRPHFEEAEVDRLTEAYCAAIQARVNASLPLTEGFDLQSWYAGWDAANTRWATSAPLASARDAELLRTALVPFAHYYDLNDCHLRLPDDALEVPIRDLAAAKEALAHPRSVAPTSGERGGASWIDRAAWCAEQILPLIPDSYGERRDAADYGHADFIHGTSIPHLRWMARQLVERRLDSETKACRWLGWLQCGIVSSNLSSLETEKARNLASHAASHPASRNEGEWP